MPKKRKPTIAELEKILNRPDFEILPNGEIRLKKSPELEEAEQLLGLINAEFQSDPMSVQCFDLRIVKRVKDFVEKAR